MEEFVDAGGHHYAYNGKEKIGGTGLYAYGFRYYDPLTARFTGVDPISDQFAFVSVYNYAENSPIGNIDLHGLQSYSTISGAHMVEALYPEKAKGLGQAAWNYELISGAGTVTGILGFFGIAYAPQATRAVMSSPTLAPNIGAGLWGLFLDEDMPGSNIDEVTRYGKHMVSEGLVGASKGPVIGFSSKLVQGVNPTLGEINCSSCALAVLKRLAGDMSAIGKSDLATSMHAVDARYQDMFGAPFISSNGLGNIANYLDEIGDGAKGLLTASGNPGHAVVIARFNGQVKILDGQSEEIIPRGRFTGWVERHGFKNSTWRFYDATND